MTRILDLSHHNKITNLDKIDDFVILKCTGGDGFLDPTFKERRDFFRKKGLYIGCYHFAGRYVNKVFIPQDPIKEADWFLKNAEWKQGEVLFLDWEVNHSDPVGWCKKWLDAVYKETGKRAYIYLNESTTNKFDWSPISNNHKLWIAKYSTQ
jgi:GH25 family lysozyme M1 (1,4-beta-N-acetylmuramidase)